MDFFKVTIELKTPMITRDTTVYLDALLGALHVKNVQSEQGEQINPREYHYDLPLERYTSPSGEWVFKASALQWEQKDARQHWMLTSRINLEDAAEHRAKGYLAYRANKPNPAGGPFKTSIINEFAQDGVLVAFAVGDKEATEALLKSCTQIGARRGIGMGKVASIKVEAVEPSACQWQRRPMPLDSDKSVLSGDYAKGIGGLRAPYWDRQLEQAVLLPLRATEY